jgi:hypothetical protein
VVFLREWPGITEELRSLRRIQREVQKFIEALEKYVVTRLGSKRRLERLAKNQPHKARKRLKGPKKF